MSLDFLLTYVEARGRAEPINLMLIDANVNFYDERIPIEEWQRRKKEGKYGPVYGQPFHGLPTLEVQTLMGPFKLAGTFAILDYLDDAFDTHDGRDMLQKGKINMIRDVSMSFLLDFYELLRCETWDDPEEHAAMHKSRVLPFLLDLSRHISMNGLRKLFGSDPATPLTAAGACAFEALELIELIFPSTLAEWPILAILRQRIASRPHIQTYLESGKRLQQLTMSPYVTPERIAIARTHPLEFKRPERGTIVEPSPTIAPQDPPFARKKKGRQLASRPSTVAGDAKGKGMEKVESWIESKAFEPGTKHRKVASIPDAPIDSQVRTTDGALSDPGYERTRTRTISGFFKRKESKRTLQDSTKEKKTKESSPKSRRSATKRQKATDRDDNSVRSSPNEITLDITRPSSPASAPTELPLPITAGQKVAGTLKTNGKRISVSGSEYSHDSDVPDEIEPRAL